jgi:spoIIIJ-associated protein
VNKKNTKHRNIEIEGATTKEAIKVGLKTLGVPRSKVKVKILSEGHKGLFGMKGSRLAKVKLTVTD